VRSTLADILAAFFDAHWETGELKDHVERQQEFVFHMCDWLDDLRDLAALYQDPRRYDPDTAHRILARFLNHATSHLIAASALSLGGIPDHFSVLAEYGKLGDLGHDRPAQED
jgi:hypothetical protein